MDEELRRGGAALIPRDKSICVVGAGPAGLGAALALKLSGYENLTIFEKEAAVGGKCLTVEEAPGVTYELGASSLSDQYENVLDLAARYGVRPSAVHGARYLDRVPRPAPWRQRPLRSTLFLSWRELFKILFRSEPKVYRPGFAFVDEKRLCALAEPLDAWLDQRRLGSVKETARALVTGIGYGYIEEAPAAYLFKYLPLWAPALGQRRRSFRLFELFDEGFQGLFRRVADELGQAVRTETEVTRVERRSESTGGGVRVTTRSGKKERTEPFDYLILACPLDDALGFLDADETERKLFAAIRTYTFHTIYAKVSGYLPHRWVFFLHNCYPDRSGTVVLSERRHLEADRIVFYVLDRDAPKEVTAAAGPRYLDVGAPELESILSGAPGSDVQHVPAERADYVRDTWRRLKEELEPMHVTDILPLRHIIWKFFPHFGSEAIRAALPRELEAIQGERSTFYAGEVMDFSVVERVVGYSRHLVEKHFCGQPISFRR